MAPEQKPTTPAAPAPAAQPSTAVAIPERFNSIAQLVATMGQRGYNVLVPTVYQEASDLFRPAAAVLTLKANKESGDCYETPGSTGKVSHSADALRRIANLQGLSWEDSRVVHPNRERWIAVGAASATFVSNTGETIRIVRSYRLDLTDEGVVAARIQRTSKDPRRDLDQKRQFIDQLAETGAMSRVIKAACNLKSSYTREAFEQPIVTIKFVPNDQNPEVRAAMLDRFRGVNASVYGGAAAGVRELPAGPGDDDEDDDETHEGEFREQPATAKPAAPAAAAPEPPIIAEPEPEDPEAAKARQLERMQAIADHVLELKAGLSYNGKPWSDESRAKPTSEKQYGLAGGSIIKALPWKLSDEHQRAIRRVVVAFASHPFESYTELKSEETSAVIEWAKGHQDEVREVVAFLLDHRDDLAGVREAVASQPSLL